MRHATMRHATLGNARLAVAACLAGLLALGAVGPAGAATPAKQLFGAKADPAPMSPRAIGSYAKGCLAGGAQLPITGPAWQVTRLSRNRNWGHPALVSLIERIATQAQGEGWRGLLVGDMAQPRGGPMVSGHASHQIGLDVDIWFTPMPDHTMSRQERETLGATSMLKSGTRQLDPGKWTEAHSRLVRTVAKQGDVDRIFVAAAIKKHLCEWAGYDRAWLRKVRPWWGHDDHLHVREDCPAGNTACKAQDAPPPGDGCGKELDWWLSDAPYAKSDKPSKPKPPLTLADLPGECRAVIDAGGNSAPQAAPTAASAAPPTSAAPTPRDNPVRRRSFK